MPPLPRFVVTFSASDPTAGAGLQADVLTLAGMGCHPLTVVTGTTAQDTHGVAALRAFDPDWIERQAALLLAEFRPAAFKLGVLGSARNAVAVAAILARHPSVPVVLDPVLASGRGDPLGDEGLLDALREHLLPLATVVTPNGPEARALAVGARAPAEGPCTLDHCAARIIALGCRHVLLTGGHEGGDEVVNTLYDAQGRIREDRWPRLPGSYHGSGCTLASALAARLAHGTALQDACREAQEFTWQALAAGFRPGDGQHLPDRFFWVRSVAGPAA